MPESSSLPARLGKYRIESVLGQGAMGVVYKGYDVAIDRWVAIKTVRTELLSGQDADAWLARFRQEVRAAGRCLHPNVVAVFDYGEEEGVPYIAMEYVQGRELKYYLHEKKILFGHQSVVFMIAQVLSALACAHACGIVHRDIKPSNIILLDDGHVKVTDFGIARMDTVQLTQLGQMVGTPSYMSPEQFIGGPVDHRTDLYSTGVVLFELLSGQRPFAGQSTTEIMYNVLHQPPRELSSLVGHSLPLGLEDVVHKALARDPARRFQTAREFTNALQGALASPPHESASSAWDQTSPVLDTAELSWPSEILHQLEAELTLYLGPLARILVKKSAAHATSLESLYQDLARHLSDPREQARFLAKVRRGAGGEIDTTGGVGSTGGVGDTGSIAHFEPEVLAAAQHDLAVYLGPIAKVLVKQAARRALSTQDLYRRLGEHLERLEERAQFLGDKG